MGELLNNTPSSAFTGVFPFCAATEMKPGHPKVSAENRGTNKFNLSEFIMLTQQQRIVLGNQNMFPVQISLAMTKLFYYLFKII